MTSEAKNFLIVAGESSGDMHGSGLVSALKKIHPNCDFKGLGGKRMREAGVKTFYDIDYLGTKLVADVMYGCTVRNSNTTGQKRVHFLI